DKKKWFDVPDSGSKDEQGNIFYNVEARFGDHPILDVRASQTARHSVYFYGPVLHMRVKRTSLNVKAIINCHSVVMRFDKGKEDIRIEQGIAPNGNNVSIRVGQPGMSKEDFNRACKLIVRCWDAWEHYQKFRKAAVTPLEEEALKIISKSPNKMKGRIMVDREGRPVEVDDVLHDHDEDDPDFTPEVGAEIIQQSASATPAPKSAPKSRGRKKAA
ncbi:MAG TPA: hypothetical protein VKA94_05660, partial [Hyphomicrobiales bacterium]|nr:hypothetical protein [Hyphomicrobiales bacterium]